MNSFYAFNMKDNLLSAAIWLTCTVQAEFTLPGVKAKETVRRKRLLFVGVQSDNIPLTYSHTLKGGDSHPSL